MTPSPLTLVSLAFVAGCAVPATAAPTTDVTPATVADVGTLPRVATPAAVAERVNPPTTAVVVAADPPMRWEDIYAAYPCNQWAGFAIEVGWPTDQIPKLLRTMWRESRCQPDVRSTTSDSCLVQVNDIVFRDWRFKRDWPGFDTATIFDPRVCLSVGRWLFGIDGWAPWRGGA